MLFSTFEASESLYNPFESLKKYCILRYYMEILHRENSGEAFAKVAAHLYNTKLTNESIPAAKQENQKISVSSSIVREKQTITLSGFSTRTSVDEVQVVDLTENSGGFSDATFRLGLDKVYTSEYPFKTGNHFIRILILTSNIIYMPKPG